MTEPAPSPLTPELIAETLAAAADAPDPDAPPPGVELCPGCDTYAPAGTLAGKGRRRRCAICREVVDELAVADQAAQAERLNPADTDD